MAESGARSSQNTKDVKDGSYFGMLSERFLSKYGNWIQEPHEPQTVEEYDASIETSQTGTCARLGALYYETEGGGQLSKVRGIDSHVFELKWLSPKDGRLCFHANFSACFNDEEDPTYFFTEVIGIKRPEVVTSCTRISLSCKDYSVANCRFCTGMWHPLGVNFLGLK